jgi:chaperonin cofactor prefoldin
MYSNKPVIETGIVEFDQKEVDTNKRIKNLEDKVRLLSEQIHKLASALQLNSRQFRRTTTDINNLT